MKRITSYIIILVSLMALSTSCIEEYHGEWEIKNEHILIVSGSIEGNKECMFILRNSSPIDIPKYYYDKWGGLNSENDKDYSVGGNIYLDGEIVSPENNYLTGAVVIVESEGGEEYESVEVMPGHYSVKVGELNPDDKYFIRVLSTEYEEEYTSTPMKPIDSPQIKNAGWKREGEDVQFNITTEDLDEVTYLTWDYYEVWEMRTPLTAFSEYDPVSDAIVPVSSNDTRSQGWIHVRQHQRLVGDNKNYGYHALEKYPLYKRNIDGRQFQVKYYTKIKQSGISKEEYEYNNLIVQFNTEMGGLFTPMPSELPSNIRSRSGKRAVGYVGVRGKTYEAEVCVNRMQTGCNYYEKGIQIDPEALGGMTNKEIYDRGYRVYYYDSFTKKTVWTYPYCIDATYWGATLEKPVFWDDLELTPEDEIEEQ